MVGTVSRTVSLTALLARLQSKGGFRAVSDMIARSAEIDELRARLLGLSSRENDDH